MASSSQLPAYYCHRCEAQIQPNLEDFTCSVCQHGFIEELSGSPSEWPGSATPSQPTQNPLQLESFLGGILEGFLHQHEPREDDRADLDEEYAEPERRSSRRSSGRPGRPNRERFSFTVYNRSNVSSPNIRLSSIDNPSFFHLLSGADSLQGDIRNYDFGPGSFDNWITVLLNQAQSGPPPASEAAIAELPVIDLTEEQVAEYKMCSICFEDYQVGEKIIRLPCLHGYHSTCVTTWLQQHATCPVCRKDLSGNDTSRIENPLFPSPNGNDLNPPGSSFY